MDKTKHTQQHLHRLINGINKLLTFRYDNNGYVKTIFSNSSEYSLSSSDLKINISDIKNNQDIYKVIEDKRHRITDILVIRDTVSHKYTFKYYIGTKRVSSVKITPIVDKKCKDKYEEYIKIWYDKNNQITKVIKCFYEHYDFDYFDFKYKNRNLVMGRYFNINDECVDIEYNEVYDNNSIIYTKYMYIDNTITENWYKDINKVRKCYKHRKRSYRGEEFWYKSKFKIHIK